MGNMVNLGYYCIYYEGMSLMKCLLRLRSVCVRYWDVICGVLSEVKGILCVFWVVVVFDRSLIDK